VEAGSVDGGVVAWCRRRLDSEPVQVLFRAGHLSQVTGLRLADGRAVVVKARRPERRSRPGRPRRLTGPGAPARGGG
jgi:hypothetical protein